VGYERLQKKSAAIKLCKVATMDDATTKLKALQASDGAFESCAYLGSGNCLADAKDFSTLFAKQASIWGQVVRENNIRA
jgi:hypothetical protein